MNEVRQRILYNLSQNHYLDFEKHKDLISFCVCSEWFTDYKDENEPDFNELIVVIEKDWLFSYMKKEGINDPLKYLQEEYTSDDSYDWYEEGISNQKIVMISFN